jgi:hypothetical protein
MQAFAGNILSPKEFSVAMAAAAAPQVSATFYPRERKTPQFRAGI